MTGLGSPTFEVAATLSHDIYDLFQREFQEGTLEQWTPPMYEGYASLSMSNRYLTPKRDAPNMVHIPFSSLVDPRGHLESMIKEGYVHGEDNEVEYYTQQLDKGIER